MPHVSGLCVTLNSRPAWLGYMNALSPESVPVVAFKSLRLVLTDGPCQFVRTLLTCVKGSSSFVHSIGALPETAARVPRQVFSSYSVPFLLPEITLHSCGFLFFLCAIRYYESNSFTIDIHVGAEQIWNCNVDLIFFCVHSSFQYLAPGMPIFVICYDTNCGICRRCVLDEHGALPLV